MRCCVCRRWRFAPRGNCAFPRSKKIDVDTVRFKREIGTLEPKAQGNGD